MLKRDFILVYIEELSKTIVQIITNRNSGAARKNPELIQSVYSTLQLDHDFLMKNNAADICNYLNHDDNYGLQRMEVAAKTLVEESYLNDDAAGTLGKALELLLQFLLHPLSAAYQRHEHEDAPEHPERRKQAAGLVAGDGDEYLF